MPRKRTKRAKCTAAKALRMFQKECQTQQLGLECAIAQLALHAVRMEEMHRKDSWQGVMSSLWAIRHEAKNVLHALQGEYPDLDWSEYEPGKEKAYPKAQAPTEGAAENGQADREAPRAIWSDGDGAQQETTEPSLTMTQPGGE